jgi:hypothetical protein
LGPRTLSEYVFKIGKNCFAAMIAVTTAAVENEVISASKQYFIIFF